MACSRLNAMPGFDEEHGPLRSRARIDERDIKVFEDSLGYKFDDKLILEEALCHSSFANEYGLFYSNERLEFLGDSILDFITARALYRMYPDANEGELTKMRSELVKADSLYRKAEALRIPYLLLHGHALKTDSLPKSICADAMEAVLGAVCIDGGVAAAERVIKKWFLSDSEEQFAERDPKTNLQLWLQAKKMPLPNYELLSVEGPSHAPTFTVRLCMNGFEHTESDRTRKGAEAKVASLILQDLRENFDGEEDEE
ncbi:MAG: ribonuclease III [Synergistaceae bacterium]|nr:ribonuclease III [Synergistaceae bacterium]